MILVDTSVWIDFFANRETSQVESLVNAIQSREDLCICGVIFTEILQGIKNKKEHDAVYTTISTVRFLDMPRDTFILAAEIYRSLRERGITIRKAIDCMIAAVAIENNIFLLHNDVDFSHIAKGTNLKIFNSK